VTGGAFGPPCEPAEDSSVQSRAGHLARYANSLAAGIWFELPQLVDEDIPAINIRLSEASVGAI
jgi:hypothetical protein